SGSNNVSVLVNTTLPGASSPGFASHVDFSTGTGPDAVAIGDLNNDGKADMAVANGSAGTISVLLSTTVPGAATPTFGGKQDFAAGTLPSALALGDVNGDGRLDVAVANANDNTVSVLLNTIAPGATTASFGAKQDFQTGTKPQSILFKDLNGDGKADLVVA